MEDAEILNMWKSYDQKLEQTLSINKTIAQDVMRLKTKSMLYSMKPTKIFTIVMGCIWVIIGGIVVTSLFFYAYSKISPFFLYSATAQLIITAIAIIIYLYQLVLIQQVDVSENVIDTQKKLALLKGSTLWSARILFLQFPLWTTFYLSVNTIMSGNLSYIIINGLVTLSFAYFSFWMFNNIHYKNRDKKWFKLIFKGNEWTPIIKSMEFYKDIEDFSNENPEKKVSL